MLGQKKRAGREAFLHGGRASRIKIQVGGLCLCRYSSDQSRDGPPAQGAHLKASTNRLALLITGIAQAYKEYYSRKTRSQERRLEEVQIPPDAFPRGSSHQQLHTLREQLFEILKFVSAANRKFTPTRRFEW
eukprot:6207070-Pleurochrysis_carterae.AAC.1